MTALRHHAKRPDDSFNRVIVLRRHAAKPFARELCCPDRQAGTECTPRAPETSFRPVDMHGLRRAFPDRWGEFCRRHFQDAEHLAAFMDVDVRTARYWLEGKHAPAAPFVLRAITAFPDAIPCLSDGDC